jgi:hypothetical protein
VIHCTYSAENRRISLPGFGSFQAETSPPFHFRSHFALRKRRRDNLSSVSPSVAEFSDRLHDRLASPLLLCSAGLIADSSVPNSPPGDRLIVNNLRDFLVNALQHVSESHFVANSFPSTQNTPSQGGHRALAYRYRSFSQVGHLRIRICSL